MENLISHVSIWCNICNKRSLDFYAVFHASNSWNKLGPPMCFRFKRYKKINTTKRFLHSSSHDLFFFFPPIDNHSNSIIQNRYPRNRSETITPIYAHLFPIYLTRTTTSPKFYGAIPNSEPSKLKRTKELPRHPSRNSKACINSSNYDPSLTKIR